MASDFADELESVARELRVQADTGLQRELREGFQKAVEPVMGRIRDLEHLRPLMPDRYADVVSADLDLRVRVLTTRNPGVSLTGGTRAGSVKRRRFRRLDQGTLEHPLFGNRKRWYRQPVTLGFFTKPAEDDEPRVVRELEAALQRVADAIDRKA